VLSAGRNKSLSLSLSDRKIEEEKYDFTHFRSLRVLRPWYKVRCSAALIIADVLVRVGCVPAFDICTLDGNVSGENARKY
jgi:hypothetical protein